MILLSSIIEKFEESFLDKYKPAILPSHKKAAGHETMQKRIWPAHAGSMHQ